MTETSAEILPDVVRSVSVDNLELSVRSRNSLKNAGLTDVGKIWDVFWAKERKTFMGRLPNFGAKSYWEVYHVLEDFARPLENEPSTESQILWHWVGTHMDEIRAVIIGRAAIVPTYRSGDE